MSYQVTDTFKSDRKTSGLQLSIKKEIVVIIFAIFSSTFLPSNLFSPLLVFAALFLLFFSWHIIKYSYLLLVAPLILIFFTGLVGMSGHSFFDIFRDVSYALTPISLIYIGYWIAENTKMWPQILKSIVVSGIIIALVHLMKFVIHPELLRAEIYEIRTDAENPNIGLVALSLVLTLFQPVLKVGHLFPKYFSRKIALSILISSFIFSFSRTGLIMGIFLVISILGYIGRINLRTIITVLILAGGFVAIVLTTPSDEVGTFRGKIARSITEIAVSDYSDFSDVNNNFRGYETFRALLTYISGTTQQKLMGHGFGTLVDLGLTINLGGTDFSEIPILHNGYAYILVKTGFLGILCYFLFYFRLLKKALRYTKSKNLEMLTLSRMLLGATMCLIFSMFVVGGMAEIHDTVYIILIAFIYRRIEKLSKMSLAISNGN